MGRMEADPRLGNHVGQALLHRTGDGALVAGDERRRDVGRRRRSSTGRQCFREIGGFVREVMWDGIDCHRCRMLGWIAESVDAEDLRFVHLRPMGSSQQDSGPAACAPASGSTSWAPRPGTCSPARPSGSSKYPMFYGSAAMLWGYFGSAARGRARYDDARFRRFLRRYQRECLLRGKRAATRRLDEAQAPVWRAAHERRGAGGIPWNPSDGLSCSAARSTASACATRSSAVPRLVPGPARPPHRGHRQRVHPLHDAPRPGLARGLPPRRPRRCPTACRWCGRRAWPASRSPSA